MLKKLMLLLSFSIFIFSCSSKEKNDVSFQYVENKEITEQYDKTLSATCVNGTFVGYLQNDVLIFKGIPYAKQPLKELRWQLPQEVEKSTKVFEAYHFGKNCLQPVKKSEPASAYKQGEDCLNLNVYTNIKNKNILKPVIIFIHGGDFFNGSVADKAYDGFNFIKNNPDVIFVSISYRFGLMGFIDLSMLPEGKDFKGSTNLGLYDQIQALKWINQNISAFGGDSKNITIVGESSGGSYVSTLAVISQAKGLFKKVVAIDGSANQNIKLKKAANLARDLIKVFDKTSISQLQNIPFEALQKYWNENCEIYNNSLIYDERIVKEPAFDLYKKGLSKDIILLQSIPSNNLKYHKNYFFNDDKIYTAFCDVIKDYVYEKSEDDYKNLSKKYFEALKEEGYKQKDFSKEFVDDKFSKIPSLYQVNQHVKNGGTAFVYSFAKPTEIKNIVSYHPTEIYYLFGNCKDNELSKYMQRMLVNFAKTGNPSPDNYGWKNYTQENNFQMIFDKSIYSFERKKSKRIEIALEMMRISKEYMYSIDMNKIYEEFSKKNLKLQKKYLKKLNNYTRGK